MPCAMCSSIGATNILDANVVMVYARPGGHIGLLASTYPYSTPGSQTQAHTRYLRHVTHHLVHLHNKNECNCTITRRSASQTFKRFRTSAVLQTLISRQSIKPANGFIILATHAGAGAGVGTTRSAPPTWQCHFITAAAPQLIK